MNSNLKLNDARLLIFHEGQKRRILVGELIYVREKNHYELTYDKAYAESKRAIPLSPDLDLFKQRHESPKGMLFPALMDRIPLRANPAYADYCRSQGVSVDEQNPIILLGSIGRRGPSSFVFEPVYEDIFSIEKIVAWRKQLGITRYDLATALDFSLPTFQKIETGKSQDHNTLKRLQIYFNFPEVALWQLRQTGSRVHWKVLSKLVEYFESRL